MEVAGFRLNPHGLMSESRGPARILNVTLSLMDAKASLESFMVTMDNSKGQVSYSRVPGPAS